MAGMRPAAAQERTVDSLTPSLAATFAVFTGVWLTPRTIANARVGVKHQSQDFFQRFVHNLLTILATSAILLPMTDIDLTAGGWRPSPRDSFGHRLRLTREELKLTQDEFVALLNLHLPESEHTSRQSLAAWERDVSRPRDIVGLAQRVADVTNVDRYWLLFGNEAVRSRWSAEDADKKSDHPASFEIAA
jgi:transcriptional regulator with XRE-family HTH domain